MGDLKKPLGKKLREAFLVESDIKDVKASVWSNVIRPGIRDLVANIGYGFIDMFFYGSNPVNRRRPGGGTTGYPGTSYSTNYTSYYMSANKPAEPAKKNLAVDEKYDYRDICFPTTADAKCAVDRINSWITSGKKYSVATLFSENTDVLVPWEPYNKWGWAEPVPFITRSIGGRIYLVLPEPVWLV